MKRLFYLGSVIALVFLLSAIAAAQQPEQDYLYQTGNDSNVTITAYVGADADVIIPPQIAGMAVTAVGEEAFSDNSRLSSIIIPEGVVSIGKAAFKNCLNLKEISLPNSLKMIGEGAFNSCAQLQQIALPDGIRTIADETFLRCLQLKKVTFPADLQSIGKMSFAVTGLETLDLPYSLETVSEQAFYGNRNLVDVTLSNSIQKIGNFAFFVCENLRSVIMPAGLTTMSSGIFDKCPNLEMVAIPMSVRQIKDDALYSGLLKPGALKVYGAVGSEAEYFAKRAGLPFEPIAAATNVQITNNDQNVNGQRLAIDLSSDVRSLQLSGVATPDTLWPGVEWRTSSAKVAIVDPYGRVSGLMKGEATITAAAVDGSGVKSSVQVNIANLAKSVSITGESAIPAKGKITLKANVLPVSTDNKNVDWTVSDSTVAVISNKGVLTASDVTQRMQVTVTATTKDGSGVVGTFEVSVSPLVSQVSLTHQGQPLEEKAVLAIDLASGQNMIQLIANVTPSDAIQRLEWKSSSEKVATVNSDGLITGLRKGSAKINAASTDGTKIVAACTINVANLAKQISITGAQEVTSGKSVTLKASVLPDMTDNKKVIWSVSDENVAKINKGGVVTAKKTSEKREVTVYAGAQDGSGVTAAYQMTIYPEASEVILFKENQPLEAKAPLQIDLSSAETSIQLSANVSPNDASQKVTWKSSDPRVASVDENGLVTALKKGKATITAVTMDGTRKNAACIITVINPSK